MDIGSLRFRYCTTWQVLQSVQVDLMLGSCRTFEGCVETWWKIIHHLAFTEKSPYVQKWVMKEWLDDQKQTKNWFEMVRELLTLVGPH